MLKVYLNVIHASLTLTDMHRHHAQFSMVTSGIDMISVVFIRDKLSKLCASKSIHTTGISPVVKFHPAGHRSHLQPNWLKEYNIKSNRNHVCVISNCRGLSVLTRCISQSQQNMFSFILLLIDLTTVVVLGSRFNLSTQRVPLVVVLS